MIYLDYAATTPVDPRVAQALSEFLCSDGIFGNPSSATHRQGQQAKEAVEQARGQVARLINAKPYQIIWTSGATESNNLAIKGVMHNKGHMISCATEHPAVLDTCRALEQNGVEVTLITPQSDGLIDIDRLKSSLRSNTRLVSIMHVNNETGVTQDLEAIGSLCKENQVVFHVDAAQSAGKIAIDIHRQHIDLLSLTAHKIYGPKGIGALFVRDKSMLKDFAMIHGGGQENGLRAGTLPTHQIVGMGSAFEIAQKELEQDEKHIRALRQQLSEKLRSMEGVWFNGSQKQCVAGILNVGFKGIDAEDLVLELQNIALSMGSACGSHEKKPSHVLKALGLEDEQVHSCVRISIGRYSTEWEIEQTNEAITQAVKRLRNY